MRQGLSALLIALSPCLMATSTLAEGTPSSVMAIDDALFSKHSELQDAKKATQSEQTAVDNQQQELDRLNQLTVKLDAKLKKAKANLERDYLKMIDEPDLDIMPSQQAYQDAWSEVKQNQKSRLEAEQKLQELQTALAQKKSAQGHIEQNIAGLEQDKLRARVERLREELKRSGEQKVSFTNTCNANMTLAQCSSQTNELGLQKAVKQFQNWLVDETSESAIVKHNLSDVSLNIHVLKHAVVESGFSDGSKFRTVISAQLDARPAENAPCKLLNLESQYCFAPGEGNQAGEKQKEVAWVSLSVRSNQYADRVTVDGVQYGSTPVEVLMPVGKHHIIIEKEGYRSFNSEIEVTADQTLRAVLNEYENVLKPGHKFADSLKGSAKAPEMITMIKGEYLLGDQASRQIRLDHAFALSATPITVGQFETFVNQTSYQTDAELKNICITVDNSEVTPVAESYWRNPGFKQSAQSPAVCISKNDAVAYTRWLSKQTGFKYRLPSEDEWEIAARSGSQSGYWWGDNFGSGKANTGWGGTQWSNKSTSPVRAFEPNRLGFYDMVGNVWEWTNDERGMAKGGSWVFSPEMAKADKQLFIGPSTAANYVGFRILREIE
ncbi:SUMF1/EgtB/PvdO family nonheme iron enzyme [Vibrio sp. Y2-5]|uniref:SUMF1/EgtB/PvdO family nonheme iron enzyme n=1 Tax=Vibrio TaxID=662 RepID=UPI00142DC229|nr:MULTISPECIES: SUMF1/EgtB/PvdO family nonheme iron enzyme [Vibrio]MBD0786005.1 SUMF1/EgtB/PvdO family nonheme iron enzyme [Vibrio sp. Y2-5]NIY91193.1 SUMF1/EgtB/PvdO family nonheme iron enzyme [Vibrio diazotrophicus]